MTMSAGRPLRRWSFPFPFPQTLLLALAAASVLVSPTDARADDPLPTSPGDTPIVRVEEDWVIEIGTPDPADHAPQIVGVISPRNDLEGVHAVLELNHVTQPSYVAGGMQLQRWYGPDILDYRFHPSDNLLATENEVIRYTMVMRISNGRLRFSVTNGSSQTWGAFGSYRQLYTSVPTQASDLTGYSPLTSIQHSRVGYASHRVKKYALKEVRYYSATGLVAVDPTERNVHQYDPEE